jgi:hypothetical protein
VGSPGPGRRLGHSEPAGIPQRRIEGRPPGIAARAGCRTQIFAELPTFLLLRCFYALGWLHLRRNSPWATAFIEPVVTWTMALGHQLLGG